MLGKPTPPQLQLPSVEWEHYPLYQRVKGLFIQIPTLFKSAISVTGVRATEIYAFGAVLGLTIEQEVIRTLNNLKHEWDIDGSYKEYKFVRQPQAFPDVLLIKPKTRDILMGIELKSWYLLAKESEPSFRYKVTPNACAPQDLLVVVPWVLSNVLSGTPTIFEPFITSARYAAEYRNYWWQHVRNASSSTEIRSPSGIQPYPSSRVQFADDPVSDSGKNFGRIARIGLMNEYVKSFDTLDLLGVEVSHWRKFFKQAITEEETETLLLDDLTSDIES